MGLINSITNWLSQPFQSGQSAGKWVLFVGLVIIAAFFWNTVLLKINEEV